MKQINKQNMDHYDVYNQLARKYKSNFKASGYSFSSQWKMRKTILDHMVQLINLNKLDILDIGCNNGLTGRTLCNSLIEKNIATNIDGVDFVEEATLIAKNTFDYRETFVADVTDKDMVKDRLGTRKYQAAICCEVFQLLHPKDYDNLLTTVYSYLIPDGYFILVFPSIKSIYHYAKRIHYLFNHFLSSRRFEYYFKYDYDLPLVRSLLQKNNFDIVSICGVDLLTNLKMNFKNSNNIFKKMFSAEFAILAKKK